MTPPLRPKRRPQTLSAAAGFLGIPIGSKWHEILISGVTLDSADTAPGDLFIGRSGAHGHGATYAAAAISAGAAAVLTDEAGSALLQDLPAQIPVLVVPDVAGTIGRLAAWVYGDPAKELTTIGVTGTNGKTTTSWLIESALRHAGVAVGLLGTLGVHLSASASGERIELPSSRTTPEATELQAILAVMREAGITHVAMEVSSHALALGRVNGLVYDLAIFTNLSQDHLDFHSNLESYFAAKQKLFDPEQARKGLVWLGDEWGRTLAARARIPIVTFDSEGLADWTAVNIVSAATGTSTFEVHGPNSVVVPVRLQLPGRFQVANAVAAVAALVELGLPPEIAAAGVSNCVGVPGRMENVAMGQPFLAVVDYAHTPDAVSRVCAAVSRIITGRLLVLVGAGGDRDRAKRSDMGREAAACAAVVVVTDDNPRSEDPAAIRSEVLVGAKSATQVNRAEARDIPDREAAIDFLVGLARPGDAV